MRMILAFILVISLCSAYSKDEHCKELVIWNPATKDTLMHFHRKASDLMTKDGACYYNTGWTAKVVTWHCQNMYLTKDGNSTFQKSHEASMTLKPYHVYCRSKWEF